MSPVYRQWPDRISGIRDMKRFYKQVSIGAQEGGFTVLLDGRPIRAPSKAVLVAPNEKLAALSAAEWQAQGEKILPDTMPVTQLLNTRQDKIAAERAALEREVLKFIDTDLLCYRADAPEELVARQDAIWQPWLDWFGARTGLTFRTTTGLGALKQDEAIHERMAAMVGALDDGRFTITQMVAPSCGSAVMALAFTEGAASADDVLACAFLEEDYKFDLYNEAVHGGDPLTEKKRKALRRDLEAGRAYLDAL